MLEILNNINEEIKRIINNFQNLNQTLKKDSYYDLITTDSLSICEDLQNKTNYLFSKLTTFQTFILNNDLIINKITYQSLTNIFHYFVKILNSLKKINGTIDCYSNLTKINNYFQIKLKDLTIIEENINKEVKPLKKFSLSTEEYEQISLFSNHFQILNYCLLTNEKYPSYFFKANNFNFLVNYQNWFNTLNAKNQNKADEELSNNDLYVASNLAFQYYNLINTHVFFYNQINKLNQQITKIKNLLNLYSDDTFIETYLNILRNQPINNENLKKIQGLTLILDHNKTAKNNH